MLVYFIWIRFSSGWKHILTLLIRTFFSSWTAFYCSRTLILIWWFGLINLQVRHQSTSLLNVFIIDNLTIVEESFFLAFFYNFLYSLWYDLDFLDEFMFFKFKDLSFHASANKLEFIIGLRVSSIAFIITKELSWPDASHYEGQLLFGVWLFVWNVGPDYSSERTIIRRL